MPENFPQSAIEVAGLVAEAAGNRAPLSVRGHGSKSRLGRPVETSASLDLSRLTGITFYEPADLVLSARAGTSIEEIEALLAQRGQELAFEPMSHQGLYRTGAGTIGGAYMTNLSGPRRIKAGALRDFVLGIEAVDGRGEIFKAGGRVVKNVTGYDLARGLAGSFGTLAVATEITLKVLPRAEAETTLVLANLDSMRGVRALCEAMGLPVDVSGAAHLPAGAAACLGVPAGATLLRLEGFAPSVEARVGRLAVGLASYGKAERLDGARSQSLWRRIRDVAPLAEPFDDIVWRVSVVPEAGPRVVAEVMRAAACKAFYDWSGGLVWLSLPTCPGAGAKVIREAVACNGGGHATLVRAAPEIRAEVPVFEPQAQPLAALSRRLKAQLDPLGILEPGRLWAGA
jgi:glycolate oxidase FAD binding subunit